MSLSRAVCGTVVFILGWTGNAWAADWANQLFGQRSHDFGSVARAAKAEHLFEFTNTFSEPLHVSSVRTSCGCTTPSIVTETVAPGEKGQIKAQFNTLSFLGQRGATITVVFDRPQYGEAQLRIDGYVRRDIVCDPGQLDFGTVRRGEGSEQVIDLQYAGRSGWKIESATTTVPGVSIELTETSRGSGRVAYSIKATLSADAPAGFLVGDLVLQTNDSNHRSFPLAVQGRVVEPVSVSPMPLSLGQVTTGSSVSKKIIVRGESDLRILAVTCSDSRIKAEIPEETKKLQMIPISFQATDETGSFEFVVSVRTDDAASGTLEVPVRVEVIAAP